MHECPKSVKLAGAALMRYREHQAKGEALGLKALEEVRKATKDVCASFDALHMEAGEAEALILEAIAAGPKVKMAHNSLRKVLCDCGIASPTDDDIIAASKEIGIEVSSWR